MPKVPDINLRFPNHRRPQHKKQLKKMIYISLGHNQLFPAGQSRFLPPQKPLVQRKEIKTKREVDLKSQRYLQWLLNLLFLVKPRNIKAKAKGRRSLSQLVKSSLNNPRIKHLLLLLLLQVLLALQKRA
jgi:hypothetical protein